MEEEKNLPLFVSVDIEKATRQGFARSDKRISVIEEGNAR